MGLADLFRGPKLRAQLDDGPHYVACQHYACGGILELRLGWENRWMPSGPPKVQQREDVCELCGRTQEHYEQWEEALARYWYRRLPGIVRDPSEERR